MTDTPRQELLVVDDNPVTRYATSRVLRAAGFGVREAGTGEEALALADEQVAGVVLDVHLPDIDGFEVCRILRARPPTVRIPVIHLSAAYIADEDKVRGLHSGADAYMTHPAEPALLVATLQALIRARTAEEGMRRSEARFRAIYAQAPSGIALVDAAGRFADVNPAMLSLLKAEWADVVGTRVAEHAAAGWADRVQAALDEGRQAGWHGELPLVNRAGDDVHLEWRLSAHAEPGLILATATDLSERMALLRQREALLEREQAARAAAERLNRSKDEFIAVLSHELRTPLNAIVSWVHVLKRGDGPAQLARGLESIERNAHIQTRLVSDILDMSRMDLGKLRLDIEGVDVGELLRSAVNTLGPALGDKALEVSLDVGGLSRPLNADPSRLQQVVWNLLTNAIKFSDKGGRIAVAGAQADGYVTITVADEGRGIEPEFLDILFERFVQGDSGSNRYHGGLGIGLSIVKHIVELHGGTVEAHSAGRGHGSTFTVRIPEGLAPRRLVGHPHGRPVDPEPEAHSLAGLRVLVVDDDPEAREMLNIILGERGARVVTAPSVAEGLLRLGDTPPPDLLVSDIGMPGEDGYVLIRELRRRESGSGRHTPAVALTAFARAQDREMALVNGFDEHCGKPLRPNTLVSALERLAAARC